MKSIQEAVASVQNAFPSIYTKDDVIKLLGSIETTSAPGFSQEMVEKLIECVKEAVNRKVNRMDTDDMVDTGSAEFELNYNEISLSSVDVDTSAISDCVEQAVEDAINEFFEEGGFVAEEETEEETEEV